MNGITICEKPDWISFRDIHALMLEAHNASGISFRTSGLTEEEWNGKVNTGGTVITALDGDRLVGSITMSVETIEKWYAKGTVARCRYVAVSPQYARRHIASDMIDACAAWCASHKIERIFWTTAIYNKAAIGTCEKNGFKKIDYFWYTNEDHLSVAFMKWLNGKTPGTLRRSYYCMKRKRYLSRHRQQPENSEN